MQVFLWLFWSLIALIVLYIVFSLFCVILVKIVQRTSHGNKEPNKAMMNNRMAKGWHSLSCRLARSRSFPLFCILKHVGRRSGKTYETPLGVSLLDDGFALPLAWGTGVDWYRNVMATGTCAILWKGDEYTLEKPEIIPASEAKKATLVVPFWVKLLLGGFVLLGGTRGGREIQSYLWLHRQRIVPEKDVASASSL